MASHYNKLVKYLHWSILKTAPSRCRAQLWRAFVHSSIQQSRRIPYSLLVPTNPERCIHNTCAKEAAPSFDLSSGKQHCLMGGEEKALYLWGCMLSSGNVSYLYCWSWNRSWSGQDWYFLFLVCNIVRYRCLFGHLWCHFIVFWYRVDRALGNAKEGGEYLPVAFVTETEVWEVAFLEELVHCGSWNHTSDKLCYCWRHNSVIHTLLIYKKSRRAH
jgi:hypothetical protein